MPRRFDWVFLDMDGTLADSLPLLYRAYADFVLDYGGVPTRDEFDRLNGPALPEITEALRQSHGLPGTAAEIEGAYRERMAHCLGAGAQAMAGAHGLLNGLSDGNYRLMLVTSADEAIARAFLERRGWTERFEDVVHGGCAAQAKPAPGLYLEALRRAKTEADQAVAVEDGPHGVAAAVAAGIYTIGVAHGHDAAELRTAGAHAVASTLHGVVELIEAAP